MTNKQLKIGLFGTGLDTYWGQFEGLLDALTGFQQEVKTNLETPGVTIIDAGMVDNPEKALAAASLFKQNEVDLVMLYVATYCLSSTILPIAQRLNCPIIVLNLQPVAAIDYEYINNMDDRGKMTGYWLQHCQACSVPEIANVFNRCGLRYEIVSGYLHEPYVWSALHAWVDAAKVKYQLSNNRMGIIGHYYGGMLDVYTDLTLQSGVFGTHFEMVEMCTLKTLRDTVTPQEVQHKLAEFESTFEVMDTCGSYELDRAARTSVALDKMVEKHQLNSFAYYYEGVEAYQDIVSSLIAGCTLLTGKGIPTAGECEVKNAHAMKIMAAFGAGGSFSEFYAMDFNKDTVLLGHDGPAHTLMAEGAVKLVPLSVYHGKPGKGLSIQMSVKHGPVTLLSVVENQSDVFLLVAEGESVDGPVLQIGNTNSHYKFNCNARNFIDQWSKAGPSHHCAIGVGHLYEKIKKLAFLLDIKIINLH